MKSDNIAYKKGTATPIESVEMLKVRSSIYALLSSGFSYPDETVINFFRRCSKTDISGEEKISALVRSFVTSAVETPPEALQSAYNRLFDPASGPHPYEGEYKGLQDFSKAQLLADIMGFYRAFGVEPRADRADHITSELEFMHYLLLKESHALEKDDLKNASICREAWQKFFKEHLVTWPDALLKAIRARAIEDLPLCYVRLMELLEQFIQTEKEDVT